MNGGPFSKRVPMAVMGALVGVSLSMPAAAATEADPTTTTTSVPPGATLTFVPPGATLIIVPPEPPPAPATPADTPPAPAPADAPSPPPPEPPPPTPEPPQAVVSPAEVMAIRRADLNSRLAEAETNVARVAEELAAADRELQTQQSYEQLLQILLNAVQADLAKLEQTGKPQVSAASAPPSTPVSPAPAEPKSAAGRLLQRVVDISRDVLADRPAAAIQVSDGGGAMRAEAIRRKGELTEEIASLQKDLDEARQRSGAVSAVVATKVEEREGHRRSVVAAQDALAGELAELAAATAAWGNPSSPSPSALALAGIPPGALELYRDASASCPGLSWTVLAAIGHIESWHGRSLAPGVHEGENFAGAMGPMQFLAPTWTAYGMDGNGDGVRDPYNHADAVHGAASYLCANGAADPPRLPRAIWHYNHADWYVRDVLELAARYGAEA